MPIISMVGCNAIGKTTAAYRYAKKYGKRLTVCIADNQRVVVEDKVEREGLERNLRGEEGTRGEIREPRRGHPG